MGAQMRLFRVVAFCVFVSSITSIAQAQTMPPASPATSVDRVRFFLPPHVLAQCITTVPTPCTVNVQASIPCHRRIVELGIDVTVSFKFEGRNDSEEFKTRWYGSECSLSINADFKGRVLGDTANISVYAVLDNGQRDKAPDTPGNFLGNNPSNDSVRVAIANPTFSAIVYDRSKFKQFRPDGSPNFGGGFGVMKLSSPDSEQIWHWRRNVDAGKSLLDATWVAARGYPAKMRQSGFPKIPDFTAEQLKLFALQSLVGEVYFVPNRAGNQWIRNTASKSDYADRIVKLEKDVASGKPPADW
jgi:hypothetical protein